MVGLEEETDMANYVYTQNPWLTAAQSMQGLQGPLDQMLVQVPAIRARMQQHADEMGLRQTDLDMRAPLIQAQAASESAQAQKYQNDAAAQAILNALAPKAGLAKQQAMLSEGGFVPGMPTRQNAAVQSNADFANALAQAIVLGQSSAATALNNEQQPVTMRMGETGFNRFGMPTMQGAMSVPFGNTLMQGGAVGAPLPTLQQGQFRPSLMQQNPAASANNLATALDKMIMQGVLRANDPRTTNVVNTVMQLMQQAGGTNSVAAPQVPGTGVKIKSIKQIR